MQQHPAIKRVLFVDDSLEYLEAIRCGITHWCRGQWELVLTPDTTEAFAILDTQHIDLVVIDLHLDGMDGLDFLKRVHRKHPLVRKAMLSGCEETTPCKDCLAEGADLYLIKLAGLETIFHSLNQLFVVPQEGFRGLLRQVSLTDLLQLECLNGRSSVLEVAFRNLTARIFIENGRIIHAQAGSKSGRAAFSRLMKIKGGDFQLKEFTPPEARTIDTSWEHLLLEAAQAADEAGDITESEAHELHLHDTTWTTRHLPPPAPSGVPSAPDAHADFAARATATPPVPSSGHPRAAEVLVLDAERRPAFQWQCPDPDHRLHLLNGLHEKLHAICHAAGMGEPARVELHQASGRGIAHFAESGWTFCRTEYQDLHNQHGHNHSLEATHA